MSQKRETVLERVTEVIREHRVDMQGSAFGGGWDILEACCRVRGPVERDVWPTDHIAAVLLEEGLLRVTP